MNNETYVLGMFENNLWSFFNGEGWVCEVKNANRLDKTLAFDLCEKFTMENIPVCIFKSAIFDIDNCPQVFSFEGDETKN